MHIIYLHQYFHTPAMQGSTRSYELARRLVAAGHRVDMVTTNPDCADRPAGSWYETEEAGIRVHWLVLPYSNRMSYRERIKAFISFARAAGRKAISLGGDVVFATSTPLTIALPAVKAAKKNRIPMVFEVRDLWPEVPIALGALRNPVTVAAAKWLERYAYRNAAQIVALSPGMKEGVVRTGYPEQNVTVIPNSCDFELFEVGPEAGEGKRREYPWLGDRPLVIYTGTLGLVNGVDYLARVAAKVYRIDPEIRFLTLGTESREKEKVARIAAELGVLDKSFFMLPGVAKKEVPAWLSAATLTTSTVIDVPALWANSANKFFDSLAAGRPIAINHGGWQADLIREHDCGLVLDVNDVEASAERLAEKVRDRQWLESASANAKRLGREQFDRDKLAAKLEQVLSRAVGTR